MMVIRMDAMKASPLQARKGATSQVGALHLHWHELVFFKAQLT